MDQDRENVRLLSIFHYVVGGMAALFACFPCIHLILGIALVSGALDAGRGPPGPPPPEFFGWFFIAIAGPMIVIGWIFALLVLMAGSRLARFSHYRYCFVVGAIECVFMPFGTVLGVFTLIVLSRPSVKALFESNAPRDPFGSASPDGTTDPFGAQNR
jgi:hypothetical protein